MKYLKLFENSKFDKFTLGMKLSYYGIQDWSLNSDRSINVFGNIDLFAKKSLDLNIKRLEGTFLCDNMELTSLNLAPEYISNDFICSNNNLTSLEGCPKYIGGYFNCQNNYIKSFKGIGFVGGFYCDNNPISHFWKLMSGSNISANSKIEMINEWEIIQGDNVYLYRLNDLLLELGLSVVNTRDLLFMRKDYNIEN